MSNERDELTRALAAAYGESPSSADEDAADAILAAGYRKPQQVTTVEELDALPNGSVILSNEGEDSAQKDAGYWYLWGSERILEGRDIYLPATVLHVGGAE